MNRLYNEIILIKCIEKWSIRGYVLLTIENYEDGLVIPELYDSYPQLISSYINDDKAIWFGVPPPSGL